MDQPIPDHSPQPAPPRRKPDGYRRGPATGHAVPFGQELSR